MNYLYLGKVCAQYEPYGPPRVSVESSNRETREKHIFVFRKYPPQRDKIFKAGKFGPLLPPLGMFVTFSYVPIH